MRPWAGTSRRCSHRTLWSVGRKWIDSLCSPRSWPARGMCAALADSGSRSSEWQTCHPQPSWRWKDTRWRRCSDWWSHSWARIACYTSFRMSRRLARRAWCLRGPQWWNLSARLCKTSWSTSGACGWACQRTGRSHQSWLLQPRFQRFYWPPSFVSLSTLSERIAGSRAPRCK